MISVDPNGGAEFIGDTKYIMVARRDGKPAPVYGLCLKDKTAEYRDQIGKERSIVRKHEAANSLDFKPPRPEEIDLIHRLYLQSKQREHSTDKSDASEVKNIWMKDTVFKNTQFMHLQVRIE